MPSPSRSSTPTKGSDPLTLALLAQVNSSEYEDLAELKVNGRPITVDATRLSQTQLQLLAYHFDQGAEVDKLPFNSLVAQSFVLLPLAEFGYQLDVGSTLADFKFNLDLAGYVHIPSIQAYLATGEGTSTLKIGGAHISITIPDGLGDGTLAGTIPLPAGKTTDVYLLPLSGGSPFTFQLGSQSGTLTLTAAGDVIGDPELLHVLQIHGDGAAYCSVENARAEASGWDSDAAQVQRRAPAEQHRLRRCADAGADADLATHRPRPRPQSAAAQSPARRRRPRPRRR